MIVLLTRAALIFKNIETSVMVCFVKLKGNALTVFCHLESKKLNLSVLTASYSMYQYSLKIIHEYNSSASF